MRYFFLTYIRNVFHDGEYVKYFLAREGQHSSTGYHISDHASAHYSRYRVRRQMPAPPCRYIGNDCPLSRLGILPPQPEGVIIVLLEHLPLVIDNNPHTPQMIRNEIARFQPTGGFYKSPAVESQTFHFQRLARGRAFVYQRAHIAQNTSMRSRSHVFCPFAR